MSKILRKFPIDDMWNIGKSESWFSDMALEGLHLKSFSRMFVNFEKGEPSKTKYRIDILYKKPSQEQIDVYNDFGWSFVANTGVFYIFSSPEDSDAPELHTEPEEQGFTLENLNKILKRNVIILVVTVLIFISMPLAIFLFYDEPYLFFIDGSFVLPIIYAVIDLYALYSTIRNYNYVKKVKNSLLNGTPLNHKEDWKKGHFINKAFDIISLSLAILCILLPITQMVKHDECTLPESKNDLLIIRLADIEENPNLKRESNFYDEDVDWYNKVDYNWSILAPIHYDVDEHGIVNDEMWEDNSGKYSPSIHTDFYQLTFENMADGLLNDLMHRHLYDPRYKAEKINNSKFDQLYVAEKNTSKLVFASRDNNVIYIRYYGNQDINHLINLLSELDFR